MNEKPSGRIGTGAKKLAPSLGVAMLLPFKCPACWPLYLGLLSSLGIGVAAVKPYIAPLATALLAVSVAPLAYGAKTRNGYGPLILGVAASAAILFYLFAMPLKPVFYAGAVLLVSASIWSILPNRKSETGSCNACVVAKGGESYE